MLQAVLKSVQVFLLNMCNTLELSGLSVYLRELRCFSVPGDRKNCKGFGLLGGISIQADTMVMQEVHLEKSIQNREGCITKPVSRTRTKFLSFSLII